MPRWIDVILDISWGFDIGQLSCHRSLQPARAEFCYLLDRLSRVPALIVSSSSWRFKIAARAFALVGKPLRVT